MVDVYLSIRGRVFLNIEALNMTESVGNYVKHRRVPVMLPIGDKYTVFFVPAISGESLAHGYQVTLAEEALKHGLPVCRLCRDGIFLKSTNENVYIASFDNKPSSDTFELESSIIKNCVVEDVGGFLYAQKNLNVKRTSRFLTGYMIPVRESIENTVIEPQLHSRYALGTKFVENGQMIYYVEISSSIYAFAFDLDTKYIGRSTFTQGKIGNVVVNDRIERIKVALIALKKFLLESLYGAKKTRFMPDISWESIILAVSGDIWTVPSPTVKSYINKAIGKLDVVSHNTRLHIYGYNGSITRDNTIVYDTFEEAVASAIKDALERI